MQCFQVYFVDPSHQSDVKMYPPFTWVCRNHSETTGARAELSIIGKIGTAVKFMAHLSVYFMAYTKPHSRLHSIIAAESLPPR